MHQLERTTVPAPICLNQYRYGRNTWNNLTPSSADREEIWLRLEQMQGERCAYCECDLNQHGRHIEHFRQRARYPQGTFDWNNLFGSCDSEASCGKHKDACGPYNPGDLIKPDSEDPEHFFLFVTNGSIALRSGLTDTEQHRARETLRIFNLDAQRGPLRKMRKTAVSGYLKELDDLQELHAICSLQEITAYIASEFAYTRDLPFCTAIKHALTP